jgi:putative DNA methylase
LTLRCQITLGGFRRQYGFAKYKDLFTPRQLISLTTFSDLILEAREQVYIDARGAGHKDGEPLAKGDAGAVAYADAVATYLAFIVDRMSAYGSTQSTWLPKDSAIRSVFNRQAITMTWDFAEPNVFAKSSGDVSTCAKVIASCIEALHSKQGGMVEQTNAADGTLGLQEKVVFATDPPY